MFDTEGEELFFEARPFLGVTPVSHMEKGVKLGSIIDGSAAQKAGLQAGDVVLKISGSEVNSFTVSDVLDFNYISEIIQGTPAGNSPLQAGDIIVELDKEPVTDYVTLVSSILSHQPGDVSPVGFI